MSTRISNIVVLFIFGGFIIFRTIFPPQESDHISQTVFNISIELVGGIILFGILQAYLYRIKVNGKYLLVKSNHRDYFQPVGGVYKTLPSSEVIFDKLDVKSDRLIETENGIAKGDLRVFVKGINVIEFLEWYDSKKNREISPWREFCEELIDTDILNAKKFRFIDYKFMGSFKTPIINLDSGNKGLFIYDIFDLIPNNDQLLELENLLKTGNSEKIIWVEDYLINTLGQDRKKHLYNISPHTKWALNMKWMKP
jgi:SMODS-associated NUDIX domain